MDATVRSAPRGPVALASMRYVAVAMFGLGGLTTLVGARTTAATHEAAVTHLAVGGGFLLVAAGLLVARRAGSRALVGSALGALVAVGVLVARSDPLGMAAVFYLWPMVFLAYFAPRKAVLVGMAVMVGSLALALALNERVPLRMDTFVGTVSAVGLMTALVAAMTDRQARLSAELARAASTDPLTGLLNRRALVARLGPLAADAEATGAPLAVAAFDLDHFKRINDAFGHLAGDAVLGHVADALRAECRTGDLVVRTGGEEFLVVLPGAGTEVALAFAHRVASRLRTAPGVPWPLATSVGVCEAGPGGAEGLLRASDQALYAAKAGGRGRAAVWLGSGQIRLEPAFATSDTPGESPQNRPRGAAAPHLP